MPAINRLLRLLMWLCLGVGLLSLARYALAMASGPGLGGVTLADGVRFGLAWLPPALALGTSRATTSGRTPVAFYLLAALSIIVAGYAGSSFFALLRMGAI